MSAYGLLERQNTLARIQSINAGRAWQGSVDDDYTLPIDPATGQIAAHTVVDFGAPIRTKRDRTLAFTEKQQPHILLASVTCIAGNYDEAQELAAAMFDLILDWAPSATSDAFEAQGGYGTRRPSTGATPTRYLEGLFFEAVVNQN